MSEESQAAPRPYVAVVGGANLDIGGRCLSKYVPRDSNPGRVSVTPGGVGRNIAQNLSQLGLEVKLITALGRDANGALLLRLCRQAGLDLSASLVGENDSTSVYLFVSDENGEMRAAINDMEVLQRLTPEYLASQLDLLNRAAAIVLDANLPQETILWLAQHCSPPLFADPVSTAKAERLRPALPYLHTLKPNAMEAELLSGRAEAERAAQALLRRGVKRVFISRGRDGVLCAEEGAMLSVPLPRAAQTKGDKGETWCKGSTTGAGDAFLAALVWCWLQGRDLRQTADLGLAAAALTLEAEGAVAPNLTAATVLRRAGMATADLQSGGKA